MSEDMKKFLNRFRAMPVPRRLKPAWKWFMILAGLVIVLPGFIAFYPMVGTYRFWAKFIGVEAEAEVVSSRTWQVTNSDGTFTHYAAKIVYTYKNDTYSPEVGLKKPMFDSLKPKDSVRIKFLDAFPGDPYMGKIDIYIPIFYGIWLSLIFGTLFWILYERKILSVGEVAVANVLKAELGGNGIIKLRVSYEVHGEVIERNFAVNQVICEEMLVFFNPEKPKNAIIYDPNGLWRCEDIKAVM